MSNTSELLRVKIGTQDLIAHTVRAAVSGKNFDGVKFTLGGKNDAICAEDAVALVAMELLRLRPAT